MWDGYEHLAKKKAEIWAEGYAEILCRGLVAIYETRFGPIPPALSSAIAKAATPETTERWVALFVKASAEDIAAALRDGEST